MKIINITIILSFLYFTGVLFADTFEEKHTLCLNVGSDTPSLTISVEKDTYHVGEIIPVTFTFVNKSDREYKVSTRPYDRSGRLGDIAFHIDGIADAYSDPLDTYFSSFRGVGGGLSAGPESLGQYSQVFDLNEWVRFDKPGQYRLYASTTRVSPKDNNGKSVSLCSQIIKLKIVPADENFVSGVINGAVKELHLKDEEVRSRAVRRLRFLSSPEAVQVLVTVLGDSDSNLSSEAFLGIIGSRDWANAKKILREKMDDPDIVINDLYIQTLGFVSLSRQEYPIVSLSDDLSAEKKEEIGKKIKEVAVKREQAEIEALKYLASIINKKSGRALGIGSQLLIDRKIGSGNSQNALTRSFLNLSRKEQEEILKYSWDKVRNSDFELILKNILEDSSLYERYEDWRFSGFPSVVLFRYKEFNPVRAKELIIEDIKRPKPHFSGDVLCSLPDANLPEIEGVLLKHLLLDEGVDQFKLAPLIERYATAKILPQVIEYYQKKEGRWACAIQNSLLRYFVKNDRKNGLTAVERAVRIYRKETGCYQITLKDVFSGQSGADIEALLISFLDDKDKDVAKNSKDILNTLKQQNE